MALNTDQNRRLYPGVTLRSLVASLFAMLVMGMFVQYAEVILSDGTAMAEQSLPVPAMVVFAGLLIVCGIVYTVLKRTVLTRQELLCVLFTMLIACPMMTQGMWHRFIGLISSPPRTNSFSYLDAYSDKLWPHGENLVDGALAADRQAQVEHTGNQPEWQEYEFAKGRRAVLPVLVNTAQQETSAVVLKVPLQKDGERYLATGEPHLVSFLAKPEDLGAESFYFIRIFRDDEEKFIAEPVNTSQPGEVTFVHQTGFVRVGSYDVNFPPETKEHVRVEIGLKGSGRLAIHDPKLFSVAALEGVYKGRTIISESEYAQLDPRRRGDLIVKPDNMFSLAGLKFLVSGYIPLTDWWQTALAWAIPVTLLLFGTLAVNILMRKQWADNERYPFPLFQIPHAMLGGDAAEGQASGFSPVFRNRWLWIGFGVALLWAVMKNWHEYDANVPDLNKSFKLAEYVSSPALKAMLNNVKFSASIMVIAISLFFEINVLASFVLGYFLLFRSQHALGETRNYKIYTGYPFRYEQAIGAYLGYALVVLLFTRKYLFRVARAIFRYDRKEWEGEAVSYPAAALILAGVYLGWSLWAGWLGVSIPAILVFFSFLLLVGFVAAKLRAECGIPSAYFSPYNGMLFVVLIGTVLQLLGMQGGGMHLFGARAMLVCLIASGFMTVSCFFLIPGAQMELLEYGRRYNVVPRHLIYTVIIGIAGGLFIGGWVFLSNSYAIGGQNVKYQWAYSQDWFFSSYKQELARAKTELPEVKAKLKAAKAEAGKPIEEQAKRMPPNTWGYVLGAGLTILLTGIRQVSAGFSFHPIGFILGSSHMADGVWGSVLAALIIRFVVLKLGGAATVKRKLMPFAVGMFLGALTGMVIFYGIAFYLRAQGVEHVKILLP